LQNKHNYGSQAMNITYKYEKLHVKKRYEKNGFIKISKNLVIYKFKNNFVGLSK